MPRTILNPTAPGASNQWTVVGPSGWEAVSRTSDDSTYVLSSTAAEVSDFFCGSGWAPAGGKVMAVTLHYRIRRTTANPATITFGVTRSAATYSIGAVNITTSGWVDGKIRVREDWLSGIRFTVGEVQGLGVSATATTIPTSGELQISKLWLEVEYIDTFRYYDPYDGVTPDAASGQRQWLTTGTEPYSVNLDNYLEINDTNVGAFRAFIYSGYTPKLTSNYITEIEARVRLSNAAVGNIPMGLLSLLVDATQVCLVPARFGGTLYLGLPHAAHEAGALANYLDIQPFDFLTEDFHIRLVVDRDDNPSTYGKVRCFVNYADAPLLEADFYDFFPVPVFSGLMAFGTDSNFLNTTVKFELDYYAWKHYRKRGNTFKHYHDVVGESNLITADLTDPDIVKPVLIDPPGVTAGQSRHACRMDVDDPTEACAIYQLELLPYAAPTTYVIDVDYKMDIAAVEGELTLQRASDLWFWDEGTSSWQAAFSSVTLTNSTVRTTQNAMTSISITDTTDPIIVTVQKKTNVPPAYKIFVYRLFLQETP